MSVLAKKVSKKKFEIPPEGPVAATLIEVRDLGYVESRFGKKPKLLFTWETDLDDQDGKPIKVFERFTNTLHPMGRLAPRIKSITGEIPDEDEDHNLSALEGIRAQLVIEHNKTDDGVYANIVAVVREKTVTDKAVDAKMRKVKQGDQSAIGGTAVCIANAEPRPPNSEEITDDEDPFQR